MSHELTDEQRMIRDVVRDFARKELEPIADRIDREDDFPMTVWKRLAELGLSGIVLPEEYGGGGADLLTASVALEELARVCPAVAMSYSSHAVVCANNIRRNGTEDQKRRFLPGICDGSKIGAISITEPNVGSDAVGIETSAAKTDGGFALNGTKTFVTNGPYADVTVLYAKTDKSKGPRGITAFLIEKGMPGFTCSRRLDKLGHRGSATGEMVLEDVEVPAANVLGEVDGGIDVLMSGLDEERAFLAAEPVGIAQGAFDLALSYAKERTQFGKPIGEYQLIQSKLADMYMEIEAARLMAYNAARKVWMAPRGGKGTEIHKIAAAAYLFAAETSVRVTNEAFQIFGGYGYCMEYPINRYLRDARVMTVAGGTSEMRRLIIGRELMGE